MLIIGNEIIITFTCNALNCAHEFIRTIKKYPKMYIFHNTIISINIIHLPCATFIHIGIETYGFHSHSPVSKYRFTRANQPCKAHEKKWNSLYNIIGADTFSNFQHTFLFCTRYKYPLKIPGELQFHDAWYVYRFPCQIPFNRKGAIVLMRQ